jgi:hypothetical protein
VRVKLGDIIHYVDESGIEYAAMITRMDFVNCHPIELMVFLNSGKIITLTNVKRGESYNECNSWHTKEMCLL